MRRKHSRHLLITKKKRGTRIAKWVAFSNPSLAELWDAPEEDYWDELYARQRAND
jgi:hypothetical protein